MVTMRREVCYPERMSTQRNRPTKLSGNKPKPTASVNRTSSQPLAAKASTPATGMKATPKAAYAPANRTAALATNGTAAHVVRAFTGGFPFAGLEYVIFLGVVETSERLAVPVGLILLGLACGVFFLRQQASLRPNATEGNLLGTLRQWLGDPLALAGSLALLGAGLLAFARWSATGARGFSVVAVIALVAAMLLMFVASYRRDAQPA